MTGSPGIVVLGMHRSGTSAVARLLDGLGLDAGPESDLIGASPDNPYGHFEARALVDLDDEILAELGGSWLAPPDLDPDRQCELAAGELGDRARELLDQRFGDRGWFWKDPRASLLVPFWRAVWPGPPRAILAVRSPDAVAASLSVRDDIPLDYGRHLAATYLATVSATIGGVDALTVVYERLLEDPEETTAAVASWLVGHGFDIPGEVTREAVRRIDATVNHHGSEADPELHAVHLGDPGLLPAQASQPPSELVTGLASALGRSLIERGSLDGALADRSRDVERLLGEIGELEVSASAAQGRSAELESVLAERIADVERLVDELGDSRREAEKLATELSQALSDHDTTKSILAERESLLEARSIELAEAVELTGNLEADLAVRELDRRHAVAELEAYQAFRAAEVATTTYQLAALIMRLMARLAPVGTRRHRLLRAVASTLRRAYGSIRRRASLARATGTSAGASVVPDRMPTSDVPVASIVIPVYGQRDVTARCLASIAASAVDTPFEVIVVDDASPDDTLAMLDRWSGIRVVRNAENQGYLRSTNAGAAAARGDVVVLLNNDTEVGDGWLDRLLDVLRSFPDTGLVGARLVYPDGRLQEAGNIIWSDGSGWNYGRLADPDDPAYLFVREVDYCSAACLAVRRNLWDELGGFDDRYAPAYYEDADLAFAVRQRGWRVRYQPAAVVVHHEGLSHGTDEASGLKSHQVANRVRFSEKWAEALTSHRPHDVDLVLDASVRTHRGRVLVADFEVPQWDRHAGALRMCRILEILVELGWQVTFVPGNLSPLQPYTDRLRQKGIEIVTGGFDQRAFLEHRGGAFDAALISRPDEGMRWLGPLRSACPDVPVLYDTVDLHGVRMERARAVGVSHFDEETEARVAEQERLLLQRCDVAVVVSEADRNWVEADVPGARTAVVGTIHEPLPEGPPFGDRTGLIFVGSWNHPPNGDAVTWFLDEVLPVVRRDVHDLEVHLVGSDQPDGLGGDDPLVHCHGWVEDLEPLYASVRLSIAPLRFGSGIKGKIGEAMAHGVPVVATSVGAEGFDFGPDFEIAVGDQPEEFAAHLVRLHEDAAAWERSSIGGAAAMDRLLGRGTAARNLERLLDEVAPSRPPIDLVPGP